jgi:hypothetical protein
MMNLHRIGPHYDLLNEELQERLLLHPRDRAEAPAHAGTELGEICEHGVSLELPLAQPGLLSCRSYNLI